MPASVTDEPLPLMARLKAETREAHASAEQALNLDAVLQSREAYAGLIQRIHAFYREVEPMLATWNWTALGLDFDARRKLPLLTADLAALGAPPVACALAPPLSLPNQAAALGALYVLEGSTLGGRYIAKRVQTALGLTSSTGAGFFAGYGVETGSYWRTFGSAANRYGELHDVAAVIHGAESTFLHFEHYLCPTRPPSL